MEHETQEQRRKWRERQQRSRQNRAADEAEDQLREFAKELKRAIRESPDRTVPRWFFLDYGITATIEAMNFLGINPVAETSPGVPVPLDDPEKIKARSDKFDKEKAECERKSSEDTRRVLWILSHGIPMSYGPAFYPNGIPAKDAQRTEPQQAQGES